MQNAEMLSLSLLSFPRKRESQRDKLQQGYMDPRFRGDDNLGYRFPVEFNPHVLRAGMIT